MMDAKLAVGLAIMFGTIGYFLTREVEAAEPECVTHDDCPPGFICFEGKCVPEAEVQLLNIEWGSA